MIEFSSTWVRDLFNSNDLSTFEALWQQEKNFVEPPNYRRKGWSGVTKLELGSQTYFLKRQEGQLRRSFMHPVAKPTYWYEKYAIDKLADKGVQTIKWAVWGQSEDKAIFITEALPGKSLLEICESEDTLTQDQWADIGNALHKMYIKRIRHGSLYPGHVYYDEASKEVCFLDLERSRSILVQKDIYRDLNQLFRRSSFMKPESIQALLVPLKHDFPKACQMILAKYVT